MEDEIIKADRKRSIRALVLCIILICCVFIGVVTKLVAPSTIEDPDEGLRSFRYFTVLSNMVGAFGATLCIPFIIDGLRNHNYHLPRWIVQVVYLGTNCLTITFLIALFFLAPATGFYTVFLYKASFYLHLICPLAAIFMFIFINDDHHMSLKNSLITLVPLILYALVYLVEVFVIGEDNGGWRDHYMTNTYIPFWLSFIIVIILGTLIANGLRVLHNKRHKKHKQEIENYYLNSNDYDCANINEAIIKLAKREKSLDRGGEVIVPRRLIIMLEKRYQSNVPLNELCNIYINAYLD